MYRMTVMLVNKSQVNSIVIIWDITVVLCIHLMSALVLRQL